MGSLDSFSECFSEKKVENNLPILQGLSAEQNGGFSKFSHISTSRCFCTPSFAYNNSMGSLTSFSEGFCKKKIENKLPILQGLSAGQNGGFSKCCHSLTSSCFCLPSFAYNNSMGSLESF